MGCVFHNISRWLHFRMEDHTSRKIARHGQEVFASERAENNHVKTMSTNSEPNPTEDPPKSNPPNHASYTRQNRTYGIFSGWGSILIWFVLGAVDTWWLIAISNVAIEGNILFDVIGLDFDQSVTMFAFVSWWTCCLQIMQCFVVVQRRKHIWTWNNVWIGNCLVVSLTVITFK